MWLWILHTLELWLGRVVVGWVWMLSFDVDAFTLGGGSLCMLMIQVFIGDGW